MRTRFSLAIALATLVSSAAGAQAPDWVAVLLEAARLPVSADSARAEGVPNNDVRAVIESMRGKNVRAHEAREVLDEARKAHREHGPVDNFGAFVQSKLDAGLRGRDLAAAIRAEHAARGKGRSGAAKGAGRDNAKGKAAAAEAKGKAAADTKGKAARRTP